MAQIAFLHDTLGLIHTDLKLENVLLKYPPRNQFTDIPAKRTTGNTVHGGSGGRGEKERGSERRTRYAMPENTVIKLIDFGGATYIHVRESIVRVVLLVLLGSRLTLVL